MTDTSIRNRMALISALPLIGAIGNHYGPDWIGPEVWIISGMLSLACLAISTICIVAKLVKGDNQHDC